MAGLHRCRIKPITAAVVAALSAPACVFAQTAATGDQKLPEITVTAPTDNTFNADTTSVGGKGAPMLIRDVPQSVTVINRAVMDSQGAASLADVLRYVPGITIGAAEGGTIGNNINLRGFSARTDLYLDGVRDRGQYYRDVFSLDAVEVLKGPSSMLFGRGSTGGVINQVSKAPAVTPRNEVSVTEGTQPSSRIAADFNKPMSDTSVFRVAAMAQDVHSTRYVMQNKDYGLAPSLRFGIGTATDITLSALMLHYDDMPDYGLPPVNGKPVPASRDAYYGLTDDHTVQGVGEFGVRARHVFSPNLTLRNVTQYSRYRTNARETDPNTVGSYVGGVFTALTPTGTTTGNVTSLPFSQLFVQLLSKDRLINDSAIDSQTDLISEFATGPVKHQLVTGFEVGRDTYTNQAYTRNGLPIVPVLNPGIQATPTSVTSVLGNYASASAITVAPYFNDTMSLTKEWKFVAGLRWDNYRANITNNINLPPQASQTVDFTSKRFGVIYQPTDTQTYYASYGTSFDPSLETLTVTSGQQALPPVTNHSKEVGTKWDLMGGNVSLTSAIFQVEQDNARSQISPGVYQLTGNIRVNGFEAGAAGRITRNWQVYAGYTLLDAKIVQASALDGSFGKVPANTPRNSAALWTTYNLTPAWEVGGGATYMSQRFANNQDLTVVGNYVRVDATMAYHQKQYDVRLNLLNLTNRYNFDALIPSDQGRSVPGIRSTALLTGTYRF
jgi:catecholate siderophore receptor